MPTRALLLVSVFVWIACSSCVHTRQITNSSESGQEKWPKVLAVLDAVGWKHDSLEDSAIMMEKHASSRNWDLTVVSDAFTHFEDIYVLQQFDVIAFMPTTGSIFNEVHQRNFQSYVEQGGSVVGVHSGGVDTNRNWPFHETLFGATLAGHPEVQWATVITENQTHSTTNFLPKYWQIYEEFYDYTHPFSVGDKQVLLSVDERSYKGEWHNEFHPISWTRLHGGAKSRVWFCAFGHTREIYTGNKWYELMFQEHVAQGVEWTANGTKYSRDLAFKIWLENQNDSENTIDSQIIEETSEPTLDELTLNEQTILANETMHEKMRLRKHKRSNRKKKAIPSLSGFDFMNFEMPP